MGELVPLDKALAGLLQLRDERRLASKIDAK